MEISPRDALLLRRDKGQKSQERHVDLALMGKRKTKVIHLQEGPRSNTHGRHGHCASIEEFQSFFVKEFNRLLVKLQGLKKIQFLAKRGTILNDIHQYF